MFQDLPSYVAGQPMRTGDTLTVINPWDSEPVGCVHRITRDQLNRAIECGIAGHKHALSRYQRHTILRKAAQLLAERRSEFAQLMTSESGLCIRETMYETGRSSDVLEFAAIEALHDDGQIFSGDISAQGKARKIFTFREPLRLMAAITPFNHPLNQVAHKLAPAIAAGVPALLKPSEKTPLTAVRFAELLYEAGLPGWMLSVFVGDLDGIVHEMIVDERIELLSFTGSVEIGKLIAHKAGYKKLCLELGGNSPLIVLADADLDLAARLAAEGCFRNSGQRCTAVKRVLVERSVVDHFTEKFIAVTSEYVAGDPNDLATRVGTVIDEKAAIILERRIQQAIADGGTLVHGGHRKGALLEPSVLVNVPRDTEMVAMESFGPLAPIVPIHDLDDAIEYYNAGRFGLSSAIVTRSLDSALKAVRQLRSGTTNVNEVPGYRLENTPFGGIKDSGLGIKEGVVDAIKFMTNVKTFSLPWGDV